MIVKLIFLIITITFGLVQVSYSLTALDEASNYSGWSNNNNEGFGFSAWVLDNNNTSSLFAGTFIGDSSDGAGNINTSGVSFGMYANPVNAFSTAVRSFESALTTNDRFSFKLALNFDNGNKGFNLKAGGNSILNFNLGSGGSVSSPHATLIAGSGIGYNYGGDDAVLDVVILITSNSSLDYRITRSSSIGNQGILYSGQVSNVTSTINDFEFYISDTEAGDQNNLYFNSLLLESIPETSNYNLFMGCIILSLILLKRCAK